MKYNIKAHETLYKSVMFRSRLEARYAAFFDIQRWKWEYEPIDVVGWTPDFFVEFPCRHSECYGSHSLLAEVKPYRSISEFSGHPCMEYSYGGLRGKRIPADSSAALGIHPRVSWLEIGHGAGGGVFDIEGWCRIDVEEAWAEAGNLVRYIHGRG